MHGPRALFLAAVGGAWALLVGSISSLIADVAWPGESVVYVLQTVTGLLAAGFLALLKKWMDKQEAADRTVMDTLREETEHRRNFERDVSESLGLIRGHLGLHREDSDPALQVRQGERRQQQDRRIIRPDGRQA